MLIINYLIETGITAYIKKHEKWAEKMSVCSQLLSDD